MLDMGFLPDRQANHGGACPAERQTLFFSATIESSVKHLVETHVRNAVRIEVGSTTKPVEQVDLHLYEVEQDRKLGLLEAMLREEEGSFLVFARTKHGADRLSKKLAHEGVKATRHPRRPQPEPAQPGAARIPGGHIACWWPPMWPRAAFTWRASPTW